MAQLQVIRTAPSILPREQQSAKVDWTEADEPKKVVKCKLGKHTTYHGPQATNVLRDLDAVRRSSSDRIFSGLDGMDAMAQ